MKILYFELSQGRKTPVYYRHNKNPYVDTDFGPLRLGYRSSRIWEWDPETEQVRCIKNRYSGVFTNSAVDRKEFLIVQLAAQEYKIRDR